MKNRVQFCNNYGSCFVVICKLISLFVTVISSCWRLYRFQTGSSPVPSTSAVPSQFETFLCPCRIKFVVSFPLTSRSALSSHQTLHQDERLKPPCHPLCLAQPFPAAAVPVGAKQIFGPHAVPRLCWSVRIYGGSREGECPQQWEPPPKHP